jgi:hypothetical protein
VVTASPTGVYFDDFTVGSVDTWVGSIGDDDGTVYNFSDWKTNSGQDANSVNADPEFINAGGSAAEDYQLHPLSPCVNAGIDVNIGSDYLGNEVPQGDLPDIGAFEFLIFGEGAGMGAFWNAVIPAFHKEFADADSDFMDNAPTGAIAVVGIRVNDVTSGTTLSLDMGGAAVAYDSVAVGEEIAGRFTAINAAGDVDSIIVYYA